jgi:Domain of unknown function (DUF6457)
MSLPEWSTQLSRALGIQPEVELDTVLDLARDAAHQVERPAAPVTTFLVGYAAALRGGSADDIAACVAIAVKLAAEYGGDTDRSS